MNHIIAYKDTTTNDIFYVSEICTDKKEKPVKCTALILWSEKRDCLEVNDTYRYPTIERSTVSDGYYIYMNFELFNKQFKRVEEF